MKLGDACTRGRRSNERRQHMIAIHCVTRNQCTGEIIATREMTEHQYERWLECERKRIEQKLLVSAMVQAGLTLKDYRRFLAHLGRISSAPKRTEEKSV